ncbi:MAG: S46 family peptidase [Chlorobi bacterium]|nr:S46 family peptidase [Chlorobiota bacterium]
MKKLIPLFTLIIAFQIYSRADEGMWIPMYLGEMNEAEMQAMGMRITADDIYNINNASLKDAIMIFGGGCTGEFVSDQGLLLTNHHCGYRSIQKHSSVEHDYLTDGFWAMDKSEELANPGLTVTLLVRMEEVTSKVLDGVNENMTETERKAIVSANIDAIKEEASKDNDYKILIKPFFYGNQYFLFVNEVFKDVRLVGTPPSNIGKFGGDTDNWMWPRHTGDFSVFRVYADKDNNPAEYSEDNVPYVPKKHLSVSTKGAKEGDFTFIFGYPGTTEEYIPSYAVDMKLNAVNPVRIAMRDIRIKIFLDAMENDPETRIQYAAKHAGISNGWKKWIGENRGIKRLKAIEQKQQLESAFADWANSDNTLKEEFGGLLPAFEDAYGKLNPLEAKMAYLAEAGMGAEIIRYARSYGKLIRLCKDKESSDEEISELVGKLKHSAESYFKDYNVDIDKKVFASLMSAYYNSMDKSELPSIIVEMHDKYKGDYQAMTNAVFDKSIFASKEKVNAFLDSYKKSKYKKILKDPAFDIANDLTMYYYKNLLVAEDAYSKSIDSLMRIYMKGQIEMQANKLFYPDANFSLRVAYGNVDGYNPDDAINFNYFTTLSGIMEKENPDIYDYVVEDKLKELYNKKDYGRYGDEDGSLHTCFIATNHTTGGNSGSPVLDADGYLIGINFDRCWEGTMSDIVYDASQCRNISLDIRYCLFIIDKFAGAGHLVDEMTVVE